MLGSSVRDIFKAPFRYLNERLPARPSRVEHVCNTLKENHSIIFKTLFRPTRKHRRIRPFPSSLVPLFETESKCETFHMKMSSACSFLFMQIKAIFIRMVSQLDSLWDRGTMELGNGLLVRKNPVIKHVQQCNPWQLIYFDCPFVDM